MPLTSEEFTLLCKFLETSTGSFLSSTELPLVNNLYSQGIGLKRIAKVLIERRKLKP